MNYSTVVFFDNFSVLSFAGIGIVFSAEQPKVGKTAEFRQHCAFERNLSELLKPNPHNHNRLAEP